MKEDERVGAEFLEYLDRDLNARQVRPRVRRIVENLWADTEDDPIDVARRTSDGVERHSKLAELDQVGVQSRLDEVHRRRADERPDEEVLRGLIEPLRHVDLDDPPVAHHRDSLTERHRLRLIVRHVDAGNGEPPM